jgi:hypothetical protein
VGNAAIPFVEEKTDAVTVSAKLAACILTERATLLIFL